MAGNLNLLHGHVTMQSLYKKHKTDFMKKSFAYRGAASWNNLPNDVANNYKELSISNFKFKP
jgi:hypothetical protein